MATSFFSLPRELRDKIYSDAWSLTPRIRLQSHPSIRLQACYGSTDSSALDKEVPLPRWLFASKALFAEAVEEWTSKAILRIELVGAPAPNGLGYQPAGTLSSDTAREVHLCLAPRVSGGFGEAYERGFLGEDGAWVETLVDHLAKSGPPKQDFKVVLSLRDIGSESEPQSLSLGGLAGLKVFPAFELVIFDFETSQVGRYCLEMFVLEEVERLGQGMGMGVRAGAESVEMGGVWCVKWWFGLS
tara:strand:+ start:10632 stop:11363 length:732 start_codon:yes stop_codon:yes gene_type:complete